MRENISHNLHIDPFYRFLFSFLLTHHRRRVGRWQQLVPVVRRVLHVGPRAAGRHPGLERAAAPRAEAVPSFFARVLRFELRRWMGDVILSAYVLTYAGRESAMSSRPKTMLSKIHLKMKQLKNARSNHTFSTMKKTVPNQRICCSSLKIFTVRFSQNKSTSTLLNQNVSNSVLF